MTVTSIQHTLPSNSGRIQIQAGKFSLFFVRQITWGLVNIDTELGQTLFHDGCEFILGTQSLQKCLVGLTSLVEHARFDGCGE